MIRNAPLPPPLTKSRRTVLAFFPEEEDNTAQIRRTVQSAGARKVRVVRGARDSRADVQPHAGLVLEGEHLLLADVSAEQALSLVQWCWRSLRYGLVLLT